AAAGRARTATRANHSARIRSLLRLGLTRSIPQVAKIRAVLDVEIDPEAAGFDPARLTRIDRHYTRYVEEGKLPCFLVVIARDGKVVHIAKAGRRDVEADLPVELDTQFRIYSMTKPITSVAAMLLWEEGAF